MNEKDHCVNREIVIVDVEATCWKSGVPAGQINEIIEVGVCVLDGVARTIGEKKSILVKPERSQVSEFCTRLTSLTQEQVEGGVTFAEACQELQDDYQTKHRLWASWGNYDRRIFKSQCELFDVPYPFADRHLNIKALFAEVLGLGHPVGLPRAIKHIGLTAEGRAHRGDDDAWNTARVLALLLQEYGPEVLSAYW